MASRAALITGGSSGIGLAIARALGQDDYAVTISARRPDKLEAAAQQLRDEGIDVHHQPANMADEDEIKRLIESHRDRFGRLDVLINNASSFFPVALGQIELSHWEELVGSNLRAPLFISQEAAPELAKQEGAIINIVDIHAERPLKGYPVYSVAKAGLAALTRALALELAPRVRVNGVAPGAIAWPEDGQLDPGERERVMATTPLGRVGTPGDVAQAVHFLACAPYVTGQIVAVDGGRSIFL
jgi:pteridine reductase